MAASAGPYLGPLGGGLALTLLRSASGAQGTRPSLNDLTTFGVAGERKTNALVAMQLTSAACQNRGAPPHWAATHVAFSTRMAFSNPSEPTTNPSLHIRPATAAPASAPTSRLPATVRAASGHPGALFQSVCAHAAFRGAGALHTGAVAAAAARGHAVLAAHAEAKKAWREARAKAQKERLDALKADNMEGYMRLVSSARSSTIDRLLSQTDACLRSLAGRLGGRAAAALLAHKSAEGTSPEGMSALEQSSNAWSALAAAFAADVPEQPALLSGGELRAYQMQGLQWLVGLRDGGINGVLADEMGLGKTVQVIALVAHCLDPSNSSKGGPFLIAAPASVLPNWQRELARWAPELRVASYCGPAPDRERSFLSQMRKSRDSRTGFAFDVALTTYEYLMGRDDRPRLASLPWRYIIVDEGHRLKNSGCKLNAELAHYKAAHRLLLTGTPLQNDVRELWSLLNFLQPDLFDSADDFDAWFGGAMRRSGVDPASAATAGEDSDAEADAEHAALLTEEEVLIVTSRLHQVLRPFMLRRLKESVAGELPEKREVVLRCRPAPYQAALFAALEGQLEGVGAKRAVPNALMEARCICNHPLISRLHVPDGEAALPPHPLPPEVRLCAKTELLDRILLKLKAAGHRVLIFSTMTKALDVLETALEWRGLTFARLDGSTSAERRGALVEAFNAPGSDTFAFLLSVRAGGVGLNLQGADTVIFYDSDWNPAADAQAAARAHRIGQTKDVLVVRLETSGTVEERVTAVAADKRGMAERSITAGHFDGKTSAAERQKHLLSLLREARDKNNGAGGSGNGDLGNAELNQLLARGDGEVAVFEAEDARLAAAERDITSRLATAEEFAPLVEAVAAALTPKDPDEGREFGRGKRARKDDVRYKI